MHLIVQLPGHDCVLQSLESENEPVQFLPPFCGTGCEHVLDFSDVPPPHVFEHDDQVDQSVNPPSIEGIIAALKYREYLFDFILR